MQKTVTIVGKQLIAFLKNLRLQKVKNWVYKFVKGDKNVAFCFNEYFSTIGSKLVITPIPCANTFHFQSISVIELTTTVAQIKTIGGDGLTVQVSGY